MSILVLTDKYIYIIFLYNIFLNWKLTWPFKTLCECMWHQDVANLDSTIHKWSTLKYMLLGEELKKNLSERNVTC